MTKLIIASNRIPVTIKFNGDEFELVKSQGGLATGLASLMSEDNTLWVGWHGSERSLNQPEDLKLIQTLRDQKFEVLDLSRDEFELFYNSVSNAILWPVYHSLVDKLQLKLEGWDVYELVNRRFADRIISLYNEGDFVWIHDYHLQLVPHMIRAQIPDAKIGFFLHIPFPSPDIFRVLPWRDEVLTGLLGADIIGFHTYSYCHHFQSTLLHILGVESYADTIQYSGRVIKFGAFPLGVDPERIQTLSETLSNGKLNEISGAIQQLKGDHPSNINAKPVSIVLSVDRMDYTKGIPRRMLAFERLLEKNPDLCGSIILIQIAAPSRDKVTAYEQYRDSVEGHVGRINGRFGTIGYHPIHYVGKSFTQEELFQIYKRVDVMLVTPLRDGMNLVAKEFIATRRDNDGVLVLSEFAGAAEELGEAVLVNPYDLDNTA
ncbi:MAG: trehalose-6-phosphate synthase, partial [Proteobacteria bacterium]